MVTVPSREMVGRRLLLPSTFLITSAEFFTAIESWETCCRNLEAEDPDDLNSESVRQTALSVHALLGQITLQLRNSREIFSITPRDSPRFL